MKGFSTPLPVYQVLDAGDVHSRFTVLLLAALLSLPHPDGYPPLNLSPQRQRQKTQEALVAWLIEEAEECFWRAIEITRRQSAKSLELRAVMSLGRLWRQQGKTGEARQLLAEIYGWFTEGFDTKDLQEAKALLEQLS